MIAILLIDLCSIQILESTSADFVSKILLIILKLKYISVNQLVLGNKGEVSM